jgi:hypothetical protein
MKSAICHAMPIACATPKYIRQPAPLWSVTTRLMNQALAYQIARPARLDARVLINAGWY